MPDELKPDEPVAYMYRKGSEVVIPSPLIPTEANRADTLFRTADGWTEIPLYAHPPADAARVSELSRDLLAAEQQAMEQGDRIAVLEENARLREATRLLDSLCAWLLHRFGPISPEGREASFRQAAARTALTKGEG